MREINVAFEIERLLQFAKQNKMIEKWDMILARNELLALFNVAEPYEGKVLVEAFETPVDILKHLLDYAGEAGVIEQDTVTYRDLLDAKIMGLLMPRQSEVIRRFWDTAKTHGIKQATDDYYQLSQKSNYIRTDRIAKNMYWQVGTAYGDIEITVNLSKPEKDPKAIAAAREMKQTHYPKCLLCLENVGYEGRVNHPARQNHRVIPITLDNEQWFLQYSPYVYYNEHCIVFHEEHIPMKLTDKTFRRFLDFIEKLPHYFVGSNADLPIVGGSILSHDHFQGGHHTFAMETARIEKVFYNFQYPAVKAGIIKWPMSVIRIASQDKEQLVQMAMHVLDTWKMHSDASVDIVAHSDIEGKKVPHNTITPIARMNKAGEFEVDLVLRNNCTSQEYPDGIFHPHQNLHHIKKENIGLIEVMGLAVLPGRLEEELEMIVNILVGKRVFERAAIEDDEKLAKHMPWIQRMVENYGTTLTQESAKKILKQEVGEIFTKVLEDAGVYKRNEAGTKAFKAFVHHAGFETL